MEHDNWSSNTTIYQLFWMEQFKLAFIYTPITSTSKLCIIQTYILKWLHQPLSALTLVLCPLHRQLSTLSADNIISSSPVSKSLCILETPLSLNIFSAPASSLANTTRFWAACNKNTICDVIKWKWFVCREYWFWDITNYCIKLLLYLIVFSWTKLSTFGIISPILMVFLAKQSSQSAFTNELQNWNLIVPNIWHISLDSATYYPFFVVRCVIFCLQKHYTKLNRKKKWKIN